MKTYIVPCSKKCGEFVERTTKDRPAVCFNCKKKRKIIAQRKHSEISPTKLFHKQHIEVDSLLVFFGQKTYIKKGAMIRLIKRAKTKWDL